MRSALKWGLALGLLAVLFTAGCARKPRGHSYVVRGQVIELPAPANGNLLLLHHEAVDDYVTRDGKVEGMDAMTMPFLVAGTVPLREIQAGDKIEVILHVDWQADRAVEITGLRKLSPDMKLDFREARPARKP